MTVRPADSAEASPALSSSRVDGRRLRSEKTRQLIIEAYMALVRENPQVPTAAQIAVRAGYSVRSVFERFPDLLALRVAAADYAIAEARRQAVLRDVDADRATRIRSHVDSRSQGCERWLPLWRVLNTHRTESEELQKRIKLIHDLIRLRFEFMFKPELSTVSDVQKQRLLLAIEAITDFESWGRMRELYGLSLEEACAVWTRALDRLLPPSPAVS